MSRGMTEKYYKGKYQIALYDKNDNFVDMADNAKELSLLMYGDTSYHSITRVCVILNHYQTKKKTKKRGIKFNGKRCFIYLMEVDD